MKDMLMNVDVHQKNLMQTEKLKRLQEYHLLNTIENVYITQFQLKE